MQPINSSSLDARLLAQIAANVLGVTHLALGQWQVEPIPYPNMNPDHRGLYRIDGLGTAGGVSRTWSVILKVITNPEINPDESVVPAQRREDNPHAPFYWKREALLFQSDLPSLLPAAFRAPHCFGVSQPAPETFWLWLEDVHDTHGMADVGWTDNCWQTAAYDLGIFSATFAGPDRLPDYPWLSQGLIRAWVADFAGLIEQLRQVDPAGHPLLRASYTPEMIAATLRAWDARETWFEALDRLPQTLCHHDVWRKNLFAVEDNLGMSQTVAIDWEVAGAGAIGEDLGNLIGVSVLDFDVDTDEIAVFAHSMLDRYLAGLRDSGWHGDPAEVRAAAYRAAMLRCLFPAVGWPAAIAGDATGHHIHTTEQRWRRPITTVFTRWSTLARFLLTQLPGDR